MKAKHLTLAVIYFIIFNSIFAAKTTVSLKVALDKKYILANALCKGGLELSYQVNNLTKDSLVVVIPVGWRFVSADSKVDYQDILITKPEILALKAKEIKRFDIKGYCCELSKSGPKMGAKYSLGNLADSNLVKLARFLNSHPLDKNTEQSAVWAVSDNEETANITHKNDSLAMPLRHFVAALKGEPLPWYTLLMRNRVNNYGEVFNHPVKFTANIVVPVSKSRYSYCYIINAKGEKISEIFGKWLNPDKVDYESEFNVAGFKKGNYTLVVESNGDKLFEREFKI